MGGGWSCRLKGEGVGGYRAPKGLLVVGPLVRIGASRACVAASGCLESWRRFLRRRSVIVKSQKRHRDRLVAVWHGRPRQAGTGLRRARGRPGAWSSPRANRGGASGTTPGRGKPYRASLSLESYHSRRRLLAIVTVTWRRFMMTSCSHALSSHALSTHHRAPSQPPAQPALKGLNTNHRAPSQPPAQPALKG